jgi:SPP1 gp7 family putative phage head morphogenesis protein
MCGFCDIVNVDKIHLFTDEEVDAYLYGIFTGRITIDALDTASYLKVSEKLTSGVYKGFGKNIVNVDYTTPDYKMLADLRENVYVFSAAKEYQQVRQMSALLSNENGVKPYNEFKKDALAIHKDYNVNYLSAEYNSAIAQSRSASMWMDIENNKALYPNLTYVTVGDGRVRPAHAMLDGITRPVGDIFWKKFFPINDWNCRCSTIQTDSEILTDLSTRTKPTMKEVPEIFRFNAGIERIVFSEKHPYFRVEPKDIELAKRNFNLPLPRSVVSEVKPIIKTNEFVPAKDIKEAEQRILKLGVKNVNLKGLEENNLFNSVLKAVEKEHNINPLNIDNLKTVNRPKSKFKAVYLQEQDRKTRDVLRRDININLHHLKDFKHTPLKSYQSILEEQKTRLIELKGKDANLSYTENMKQYLISQVEKNIKEYEKRISDGLNPKWFSTSSMELTPSESLHTTMIHELGHHRHEFLFKESVKGFTMSNTITQYSGTNKMEYFAEWYSTYRKNGSTGVPDDILKLFKSIDNGK